MTRSDSATGPGSGDLIALCDHSHLFRGSRLRLRGLPRPEGFAADPEPSECVIVFSDGAEAKAELLVAQASGAALVVPARTTAAGTRMPEQSWSVRGAAVRGDDVELRLGSRLPGA